MPLDTGVDLFIADLPAAAQIQSRTRPTSYSVLQATNRHLVAISTCASEAA